MAKTDVNVREASVWAVEAKCGDSSSRWRFNKESDAKWFRKIAQEWYCARCPKCGMKDIVNINLELNDHYDEDQEIFTEVIVSCGFWDCDFAKRIVQS